MKHILYLSLFMLSFSLGLSAQQNDQQQLQQRFSPEKFFQDMKQFITQEAHLTQQEADKFFPLYIEMQQKMRPLYDRQRQLGREHPQCEQACLNAIKERDEIDIKLRQIQQTYHNRFLEELPASKVYDILKAEERFHRRMMRGAWGMRGGWGQMSGMHRSQRPSGQQDK